MTTFIDKVADILNLSFVGFCNKKRRMRLKIFSIAVLINFCYYSGGAQSLHGKNEDMVIIQFQVPPGDMNDSIDMQVRPADYIGVRFESYLSRQRVNNKVVKWILHSSQPLTVASSVLRFNGVVEPGDSIDVDLRGAEPVYSGIGKDKFLLAQEFERKKNAINKPDNAVYYIVNSIDDYNEYSSYMDKQQDLLDSVFGKYQGRVSNFSYSYLKAKMFSQIENKRLLKFGVLCKNSIELKVAATVLCNIFDLIRDSDVSKWLRSLDNRYGSVFYYYCFLRSLHQRKYDFQLEHDSLANENRRKISYYELAKNTYKGHLLENCLAYMLTEAGFDQVGLSEEIESLLADYYRRPGFVEYKNYVRYYEAKRRMKDFEKGFPIDFSLTDELGRPFALEQLKGKIILMNFWEAGDNASEKMASSLQKVYKRFKEDTSVVFINLSTDMDGIVWLRGIAEKRYTVGEGLNLYTKGKGRTPLIEAYSILNYPSVCVWNSLGKVVKNPLPDPTVDSGKGLVKLIEDQLEFKERYDASNYDGPYLFYRSDSITMYSIDESRLNVKSSSARMPLTLSVRTDDSGESFEVVLKGSVANEPAVFEKPDKMLALSDIEGNFNEFRELLVANGVIDEKYNWLFGKGHLVIAGDVFDRGRQVTECLWLIYSLEEKAKRAGGYVHFVLGNHEIMNLSGNIKYMHQRYKNNIELIGMSYKEVYSKDSELGRWLRTKNIVEKIGDILITHGGIAPHINKIDLSIDDINSLARPFYDRMNAASISLKQPVGILYNNYTSPFWYRHYYKQDHFSKSHKELFYHATYAQVDSTLRKFEVNHIVTGHTIIADSVSVHYGGKVINTDTKHAEQKSEALLVDEDNYYRVNTKGARYLLFKKTDILLTDRSQVPHKVD